MSISSELSNSLLILIEGNQNGCAVVAYRSAFTWLAIMSSTPPPPNSPEKRKKLYVRSMVQRNSGFPALVHTSQSRLRKKILMSHECK